MRIRLTLRTAAESCEVVVEAPPGCDVARLREPVAAAIGSAADAPWWSARRLLPDSAVLGGPGLRTGDEISLGSAPEQVEPEPAPLHLAVVAGPGAGLVLPLGRGVHLLGRSEVCDLRLPDAEVSRRHAAVTVTTAGVGVRDLDSRNGTLRAGVEVDRDGGDLEPGDTLRLGCSTVVLRSGLGVPAPVRPAEDGRVLVLRAPVDRLAPVARTLTAPTAPAARTRPRIAWAGALVPAVAGIGLAWFLHTWQFLAFAALTPLTVLGTAAGDRWSWRAGRRRAAAELVAARVRFDREREGSLAEERETRLARHPDPVRCLQAAQGPAAPLWQGSAADPDRLYVRLGVAPRPSRTRVVDSAGVTGPAGTLDDVAMCADLAAGPLGLAGPPGHVLAVARAALVQLVVAHPPGGLELVILLPDATDDRWDWLRWLPHRVRRAADPAARAAVLTELAARVQTAATRTPGPDPYAGPLTVVLVDRAGALADHPALDTVLRHGRAAGIHAVCVEEVATALPAACTAVAATDGPTRALLAVDGRGWDTADGSPDVCGPVVADQLDPAWCTRFARAMAPLDDGAREQSLPRSLRLADVTAAGSADDVAAAWASRPGAAPPLRAVVGRDGSGPAVLDLTADGPHALVAGTTGSGKSALLQTWISALALAHPPDDLGLLLVDYKGGAAFGACARLPHTLGLVTDLDPHLTGRVLRSLDAEIRRRERLFAASGAADLAAHRRTGGGEAVPRLLVVVDEFATLAADLPAFVPGLVDVAQRGRSLGVHLVLATQRPGHAVSPAIRANTTLRIALRVTDPAESADVVGVAAAASLDPACPGRMIVRTGKGVTAVQAARVSGPVGDAEDVVAVHRIGPWEQLIPAPTPPGRRTDLDDLVEVLDTAWASRRAAGAPTPRPTWLPPLPEDLDAAGLAALAAGAPAPPGATTVGPAVTDPRRRDLAPAIGLRDQPDRQRQVPERLDLAAGGTLLLAGSARSGRSETLLGIARLAGSAAVPTVVVDGGGLAALAEAPTTIAHVTADDADTLMRLIDLLEQEFTARRERPADGSLHPLTILLDGWTAVATALDELDGGRSTERLLALWRAAGSVGVTVVVAGDRSLLAPRTASAADRVLLLRLADPADAALAGLTPRDLPDHLPPGRAVSAPDGELVQLARAAPASAPTEPRATLTDLRLRALPTRVALPPSPPAPTGRPAPGAAPRLRLGVGGDRAVVVSVDPWAGAGRWLVAGPPRSGRSTVLAHLALEAARAGVEVHWWARPHSPLAAVAGPAGWAALTGVTDRVPWAIAAVRDAAPGAPGGRRLVVLDDVDDLADAPLSGAVVAALREAAPGRLAVVCAGRSDELLVSYRGVVAEVRRARRGLLLRPGPGDGDLVGIRTGRASAGAPPGRGLLVADGVELDGCAVEVGPVAVQVAAPPRAGHHRRAA